MNIDEAKALLTAVTSRIKTPYGRAPVMIALTVSEAEEIAGMLWTDSDPARQPVPKALESIKTMELVPERTVDTESGPIISAKPKKKAVKKVAKKKTKKRRKR